MLNLCVTIIKKEPKTVFQDLSRIIEALIKYRRAISQKQFEIIGPKMREILRLIESDKLSIRADSVLIEDLKELVGDEVKPSKTLRSTKNNSQDKDDFVVVDKVWKLEPSKLTEHQREKMKKRRCDIPALYNDLSQSQDSASIQGWAPKMLAKMTTSLENVNSVKPNEKNEEANELHESADESFTSSQRAKKVDRTPKGSPKRLSQSQSQSQSQNSADRAKNDIDKDDPKRRLNRELNRIQIDANVDEVPYSNLTESNRLTRSTVKKIEEDTTERRKTRSDSTKPAEIKLAEPAKDIKKKTTRASLANSPVPSKSKAKGSGKSTSADSESPSEPTPSKRRSTRQTKPDESDLDELIPKTEIPKKTDFIDTLELKVEKLPTEGTPQNQSEAHDEKHHANETEKEVGKKEKDETMEVDEPTEIIPSKCEDEDTEIVNEKEGIVPESENKIENRTESLSENKVEDQTADNAADKIKDVECMEVDNEPSSQVLVTTETVPVSESKSNRNEDLLNQSNENDVEMEDKKNETAGRSYMSALVFDDVSFSKSLNGSTIITSPEIDAPRSLEFLNDTLNISPIASDNENTKKDEVSISQAKKKLAVENVENAEAQENDIKTEKYLPKVEVKDETESKIKNEIDSKIVPNSNAVNVAESPVAPSTKSLKSFMQSSTPVQSNCSPVSSKFKPPLLGRGAQLLKMINSNKSPKPASPTLTPMNDAIVRTASPTINQLETAPIFESAMNTPEPKANREKQSEKPEPNENGDFLTLSGALPSPFESPGISILKRKSSNISMDDSVHSPAPKRKRVSFGFPLFQTKEYIIDEDFTPFYMLPSNDSPCGRANRLKRKLKLSKNQNNSAKTHQTNDKRASHLNNANATSESTSLGKPTEEVSVKQIQEFLGMDADAYRAKQENRQAEENTSTAVASKKDEDHANANSDDSSTESNEDDPEIEAIKPQPPVVVAAVAAASSETPQTAKTLAEFSDDAIFAHLMSKYSANELLKKMETTIDAKALTKRLSTIMATDKQVETAVLEEFAEKHSECFLEHAITENLCSVICDRLTAKSPNAITDYTTEKINNDDQFASDFLDRVSVAVLRQKLMDTISTSKREQHILLDDFLTALKDYISSAPRISPRIVDTGNLPEHIHLWVSKLFNQFKLSPEQYLQLTSIYIQKNPPPTLDSLD